MMERSSTRRLDRLGSRLSRLSAHAHLPKGATYTQLICLAVTALALTPPIIAGVMVILALGLVLSPFSIIAILVTEALDGNVSRLLGIFSCLLYLFCVVGWPYLVAFWLGPWSSTAVAIGHCASISVLISTVYIAAWLMRDLRKADLEVHGNEITVLESSRLWHLYLISVLSDWYQYSALSFSTPDIKLPPSVQDLLDTIFSLGRFSLPFLPREVVLSVGFVSANALMCAGPMFYLLLVASPIFRTLVTSWVHPVPVPAGRFHMRSYTNRKRFCRWCLFKTLFPCRLILRSIRRFLFKLQAASSEHRWRAAAQALKEQFPLVGGTLVHLLNGADVGKWRNEISIGLIVFTSFLVGVVSANLRVMACVEEDDEHMFLAVDPSMQCWTPTHTVLALAAGLFLTAFLPAGLLAQLQIERQCGVLTHCWYTMLERPLKLLTVGVAVQSEALKWTRVRLIVTSASAAGIAVACHSIWSCNNAGLNRLRQLTWWSATINSMSSWIHFEMGDAAGYIGIACFLIGHTVLAAVAFSDAGAEYLFTHTLPMQRLRRFTRLLILLLTVASAFVAGILPQLLAMNTGAYLEQDLYISDHYSDSYTVITDSCAVFVRTTCSGCNEPPAGSPHSFSEGVVGGRLRIWGSGSLLDQTSSKAVIVGTDLQACELWLLLPRNSVLTINCNGACTLHASGIFVGSLALSHLQLGIADRVRFHSLLTTTT